VNALKAIILAAAAGALVTAGCHSDRGTGPNTFPPPSPSETTVPVGIVVPQGVPITTDSLRVSAGAHPVGTRGSGTAANIPTRSAVLLTAIAPNNNPVLLAISPGVAVDSVSLGLQSTAEALVFLTPGLVSSAPDTAQAVIAAIRASEHLQALEQLLLSRLAVNPSGALVVDDSELADAVGAVGMDAAASMRQLAGVGQKVLEPVGPDDLSGVHVSVANGAVTLQNTYRRFLSAVVSYSTDGATYQTSEADNGELPLPRYVISPRGLWNIVSGNPKVTIPLHAASRFARVKVFGPGFGNTDAAFSDPDVGYAIYPVVGHVIFNWAIPLFEVVTGVQGLQSLSIWGDASSVGGKWISATASCAQYDVAEAALFDRDVLSALRPYLGCAFTSLLENPSIGVAIAASAGVAVPTSILSNIFLPFRVLLLAKTAVEFAVATHDVAVADAITVFPLANSDSTELAWADDFETYASGTWPNQWIADGNSANVAQNEVDGGIWYRGQRSLRLYGIVGGCLAALGYHAVTVTPPFDVEVAVRNGDEVLSGCHQFRAAVRLRQCCTWRNPSRELVIFRPDGALLSAIRDSLTSTSLTTWYKLRLRYELTPPSNVTVYYWLDGQYLGARTTPLLAGEANMLHLELTVEEGTAWFDDVKVTR